MAETSANACAYERDLRRQFLMALMQQDCTPKEAAELAIAMADAAMKGDTSHPFWSTPQAAVAFRDRRDSF